MWVKFRCKFPVMSIWEVVGPPGLEPGTRGIWGTITHSICGGKHKKGRGFTTEPSTEPPKPNGATEPGVIKSMKWKVSGDRNPTPTVPPIPTEPNFRTSASGSYAISMAHRGPYLAGLRIMQLKVMPLARRAKRGASGRVKDLAW